MIDTTKIALAHDSFTQLGGAERVFDCFHEMFPTAPVYTLVTDKKFASKVAGWKINTSFLQKLYPFVPGLQYLLPLIPWAVSTLRPRQPLVLSSSSSFIRNIRLKENAVHVNYCHTPARFLWLSEGYINQELPWYLKPFRFGLVLFLKWMKQWDYRGAQRVTHFIANSVEVKNRIQQFYQRDSVVIHPFADTTFWYPTREKQDYFLIAGRLHAHKNNELVIQAFNDLGWPLHVVGTGRQEQYLRSIAKATITFLGRISDEKLRDEYSGARGYIFPQFEDFGMMPIEAAACGTATLGLRKGGSLETIVPGVTGQFFSEPTKDAIKAALLAWDETRYDQQDLRAHASQFGKEIFKQKILHYLSSL